MSASISDICNQALIRLNGNLIAGFNDGTKESIVCSAAWDFCRRALLRSHIWNFAEKQVRLGAAIVPSPTFEWSYAFQLPADCLRVVKLYQESSPWVVTGRTILTNDASVSLYYISDITDPTQFDPSFADALAAKLAIAISGSINADITLMPQLKAEFDNAWKIAKQYDAQEDAPMEWIASNFTDQHENT